MGDLLCAHRTTLAVMEAKGSRTRVAFALLCGLAVCCSVMYITTDGETTEEAVLASKVDKLIGAGYDRLTPRSFESVDVMKAGVIITNTPDGRMRLLKYLNKVEAYIAKEVAGRRADVAAIRAHMAKNMAYNIAARKSMKKKLLSRMAKNAHTACTELKVQMTKVQNKFAAAAALANKRNNANIRRSKKTREIMRKNKRRAAHNLRVAVLTQQRSLAALASATNAKIHQTNKHIAANAAQIKENAKRARQALDKAMGRFDKKIDNVGEEAKKGRSKLAQQMAAQDKAFRNFANNKIKAIAASTAAQFRKVRATMAKDRHHADMMLKAASSRMDAALNANQALQDKRFAKTVADISAAKKEAKARVNAARSEFKVGLMKLGNTVKHQVSKLNNRVSTLSATVTHNRLEQARVNRNVHAETMRMIKLGNKRYKQHLKHDKELRTLMAKNKAATDRRMRRMADSFSMALGKIRKQMKKDRRHSANRLRSAVNKLSNTMARNSARQAEVNGKLSNMTHRARLDAADALRGAKASFASRLAKMHAVAVRSARKQQKRINKLTGVVNANAVKSARGRALLHSMRKANKAEISAAISGAIHKGEQRALAITKHMKSMNKKTVASLNAKISSKISTLRKQTQRSLFNLSLESKAARAEMKKEIIYAVKSAAKNAKANLQKVVNWSTARMTALKSLQSRNSKASAKARASIGRQISSAHRRATSAIKNAVAQQNRALLALKSETAKKLKKTNKSIDSHAKQMAKNAAARSAATAGIAAAQAGSVARYSSALGAINKSLSAARRSANRKFGKLYVSMAKQRASLDKNLARATHNPNNKLAEQAALQDARFRKTVKNIAAAKGAASAAVAFARKDFSTQIVSLTASVKNQETRLRGEIAVVSGEIISNRAAQARVNRRVNGELNRIVKVSNTRASSSARARGKLRSLMNANKRAASEEVGSLAKRTRMQLSMLRGKMAHYRRTAAKNLSSTTKRLYTSIADASKAQSLVNARIAGANAAAKAASMGAIRRAKKEFAAKVDTLTNTVSANNRKFEKGLKRPTGVAHSWKKSAGADRRLMRQQRAAINSDLTKSITRSIQLGEARAKKVENAANAGIAAAKKSLNTLASEKIEKYANKVFAIVNGNRQKIADNYLSLKAYAATAADKVQSYVAKGKGRNLSSIGDLLTSCAQLASVRPGKDEGVGAGAKTLPLLFSSKTVKVANPVTKINFLVDEYIKLLGQVQQRWPMGLGKYLLSKVESNMQSRGVLEVDRIEGKAGNFVFINARSVC